MTTFYSASTGGFYDDAIHETVPDDAVEITADEHRALLDAQDAGKRITHDSSGHPVATDPPAPTADQMAASARLQREQLLRACDWTALPDVPLGDADKVAWCSYRQALRDVPEQAGFPATIAWPTAPGAGA